MSIENNFDNLLGKLSPMEAYAAPWFVCGGWAIDLFVGSPTRAHHDIDIGIFRNDQPTLRQTFPDSEFYFYENEVKHPWPADKYLELPVHEIRMAQNGMEMEFVLNERLGDVWQYRRLPIITLPVGQLILRDASGIPYLAPEVAILFKSTKWSARSQHDWEVVKPLLPNTSKAWLADALAVQGLDSWISL